MRVVLIDPAARLIVDHEITTPADPVKILKVVGLNARDALYVYGSSLTTPDFSAKGVTGRVRGCCFVVGHTFDGEPCSAVSEIARIKKSVSFQ